MPNPVPAPDHDVVVLGGGPAGVASAVLLSAWGYRVALVTRTQPPAPQLALSIPPSARDLLARIGVLAAMHDDGHLPNGGNTVWWAGGRERVESFEGDTGFQVDRASLERTLGRAAAATGVDVRRSTVRTVRREEGEARSWVVRAGDGELRARWALDATGRAGLMAKPDLRTADEATRTVALVRRWRIRAPTPRETHTLVESYRDGWAWSVPLGDGVRCFTAMVDPSAMHVDDPGPVDELFARELAKTRHLSGLLSSAEPVGGAWACPASLYGARTFGGPGFLLVGDAGSFIDPLSSYGVKKALASGWLAAVATRTALDDPDMEEHARAFQGARERAVYGAYRRLSAPFFREAARAYAHPYWEERADAADAAGGVDPAADPSDRLVRPDDDDALPARHEVERAWSALKDRDALAATPGATLGSVRKPGLAGDRVVLLEHLTSDRWPGGIRWVAGVCLTDLVRAAPEHGTVPALFEALARRHADLSLPAFVTALSTAFAAGFLECHP